jgi:hypothetical protein
MAIISSLNIVKMPIKKAAFYCDLVILTQNTLLNNYSLRES